MKIVDVASPVSSISNAMSAFVSVSLGTADRLSNAYPDSGVKPFSCSACNYSFTRSDLLVRHERLTHKNQNKDPMYMDNSIAHEQRPAKRIRTSSETTTHMSEVPNIMTATTTTVNMEMQPPPHPQSTAVAPMHYSSNDEYSLAALSMAAEYQSLQGTMSNGDAHYPASTAMPHTSPSMSQPIEQPMLHVAAVESNGSDPSLDNLGAFLDNEPLTSYRFASIINTEQPMPFFSPESFGYSNDILPQASTSVFPNSVPEQGPGEEANTASRFGSRLPSLQPDDIPTRNSHRSFADISLTDRQKILDKLEEFPNTTCAEFKLPTRLALCRYLAAYINGFHEHMPFLHIPTMSVDSCSIELLLAMAAIGAQYTFEGEKGVELFNVSRAISTVRIRRRDARLSQMHRQADLDRSPSHEVDASSASRSPGYTASTVGPLGLPSGLDMAPMGEDLMQTAQALLLLMALCTWAKHKEILREALAIQSVLATLIRDDGLENEPLQHDLPWDVWVRRETIKRTKFIVYGFSNLHCIVYNIPPFILTSEVKLTLPCSAAEFKAPNEEAWRKARKTSAREIQFQDALSRLFSKNGRDITEWNSSAGNYALIHALIQHIFFVRQVLRCRFDGPGELSQDDVQALETALRNWQTGWKSNPESSLDPMSPSGPVAFNSTALLRLAYIRLYVDTAGRALDTRDPVLIANAFRAGPAIKRSAKITRAVLHSVHALSIPVKIGYRLVAKTQSFIWSIQHSLCTLECAYLMSKWLEALSVPTPDPPITDDERRITVLVKSLLEETEFAVPPDVPIGSPAFTRCLSAGVLRVWATIFRGAQTWAIVDVIGSALNLYADMLESG